MDYGRCNYGERCGYAHGEEDRRQPPLRHPEVSSFQLILRKQLNDWKSFVKKLRSDSFNNSKRFLYCTPAVYVALHLFSKTERFGGWSVAPYVGSRYKSRYWRCASGSIKISDPTKPHLINVNFFVSAFRIHTQICWIFPTYALIYCATILLILLFISVPHWEVQQHVPAGILPVRNAL